LSSSACTTGASAKGGRDAILAIGASKIGGTRYTVAEVINAFANYFKHRDEWNPVDWSDPKGLNTNTLKVITAIGATPASDGAFRTAAQSRALSAARLPLVKQRID
jgi:hypothetical protein